jgi:hypothetical protein
MACGESIGAPVSAAVAESPEAASVLESEAATTSSASPWRRHALLLAAAALVVIAVVAGLLVTRASGGTKAQAVAAASTTTTSTTSTSTSTTTTTTEPPTTAPPETVIVVVTEPPPPPTTTPKPHKITGTLYLFDANASVGGTWKDGQSCYGQDGYSDIGPGTQVTVRNEGGVLIGTTTLGAGSVQPWPEVGPQAKRCVFPFTFGSVPDAGFYGFEVSHRGEIQESREELSGAGWHIDLYLG